MDIDIKDFIKDLPKVDLHIHLEATTNLDILEILDISKNNPPFSIFNEISRKLSLNYEDNITMLLKNVFEDRYNNNIWYTQFQYSGLKIWKNSGYTIDLRRQFDIISNVINTLKVIDKYKDIYVDFIVDIPRGTGKDYEMYKEYILDIVRLGRDKRYGHLLRGVGIGGKDEGKTPFEDYKFAFDIITKFGELEFVPHCGEFGSNKVILDNLLATFRYKPKRIGHGIRIVDVLEDDAFDNDVKTELKTLAKNIHFDVSITSNATFIPLSKVNSNAFWIEEGKNYLNHPIKKMIKQYNIYTTLSTDDPGIIYYDNDKTQSINLNSEYKRFSDLWTDKQEKIDQIVLICIRGIRANWTNSKHSFVQKRLLLKQKDMESRLILVLQKYNFTSEQIFKYLQ
jgi:adenosine deaminase